MVAVSTATVEPMEADEDEEDDKADADEGSSTKDLAPKQVLEEVEEKGTTLVQEDGSTVG